MDEVDEMDGVDEVDRAGRLFAAALFVTAGVLMAGGISLVRHVDLAAFGLMVTPGVIYLIAAGCVLVAVAFARYGVRCWRAGGPRLWVLLVSLVPSIALCGFFSFAIYCIEIKYTKGDSNLGHLARLYHDLPGWQSRAAIIKRGILHGAQLEPLPVRTPLNAVIHSLRNRDGYTVENVYFESIPGLFVLGNLYRPAVSADKKPIVLIAQGHFPNGRFNENTQQLAATFARMGAIAFSYDMIGRGESRQLNHNNSGALTMQLWDSMRVLDFLLGLPDADKTRVGMTGASGGGTQTFLCTAVDDRVTVSAPVVMVSSWVYGGCACESSLPIHHGAGYATNNAEIAALAAPRPQLLVSDGSDWTQTTPWQEFPYIRNVYRLFGKETDVQNVHLAGERHDYGPSKRDAVYRFFAEHLGLDLKRVTASDGTIDESSNTVEPEQTMRAFDDAHAMPENALRRWDDVRAVLVALQK